MAAKHGFDFLQGTIKKVLAKDGYDHILKNFSLTSGGDGRCTGEFLVTREHLNYFGGLHGGCTALLIDDISTFALMSKNSHPGVSVVLQITYIKPAAEGDVLVVDANTVKMGRKFAFLDCNLKKKSDGSLIARGQQTKFVDIPSNK